MAASASGTVKMTLASLKPSAADPADQKSANQHGMHAQCVPVGDDGGGHPMVKPLPTTLH